MLVLYELGDESMKKKLVDSLISTLTSTATTKPVVVSASSDTVLFENGELEKISKGSSNAVFNYLL